MTTCGTCRHAKVIGEKLTCRRYPATVVAIEGRPQAVMIGISAEDLACGEYDAIKPEISLSAEQQIGSRFWGYLKN